MKKYIKTTILSSILLLILGSLLIFKSAETLIVISYIIGGVLAMLGTMAIIKYIKKNKIETDNELDIIYGLVTIAFGMIIIFNPKYIGSILPFVLGLIIFIASVIKVQYARLLMDVNNKVWKATMLVAIISGICGFFLIINPFIAATLVTKAIGIYVVIYSILDIISTLSISKYAKDVEEIKEEKTTENEGIKPVYSFSQTSLDKMLKVHPKLVEVMKEAIKNSPFDFRITDGARTAEEQFALYQKGRTKPGPKVTNCDGYKSKSNHQIKLDGFGHAVDIFPCGTIENGVYRKFTADEGYDDKKLKIISEHILKIAKEKGVNVEWGGNWKMHDTPHFEIK